MQVGASGYRGVKAKRGKGPGWEARICLHGNYVTCGTFLDKEEAARAHDRAALMHKGSKAQVRGEEEKRRGREEEGRRGGGRGAKRKRLRGVLVVAATQSFSFF